MEKRAMIKDIVVNLPVGGSADNVAKFAVSVAATLGAHLTGIAFRYGPLMPLMVDMYGIPPEMLEFQSEENEQAVAAAIASFNAAVRGSAVASETQALDAPVAGTPAMLGQITRRFDLSIVVQPRPQDPALARLLLEAALFESGRPVLIMPYIQTTGLKLDRVLVGWDGSRSAARAIGDATAFLRKAKRCEILIVSGEPAKSDELPGADIAHHLARHDIKVEVNRITSREIDVASAILSHAADASADLLVMGGYGHSRMREFILGGVTRGIVASMTVPTLMSH
jgi:nucleotide-binding universal stress UspA family protein